MANNPFENLSNAFFGEHAPDEELERKLNSSSGIGQAVERHPDNNLLAEDYSRPQDAE